MSKVKTRTRSETSKSDETVKKTKSTTNVNIDPDDNQVNSVVDLVLARRLRSALKGSESDCSPCFFTLETSQTGKTLGSPYRSSPTTPNKMKLQLQNASNLQLQNPVKLNRQMISFQTRRPGTKGFV